MHPSQSLVRKSLAVVFLSKFIILDSLPYQLSQRSDVLEDITLCLPIFHSFGHKVSCQVCMFVVFPKAI